MSNTMKNKFEKFLQELFSRGVDRDWSVKSVISSYLQPKQSVKYMNFSQSVEI